MMVKWPVKFVLFIVVILFVSLFTGNLLFEMLYKKNIYGQSGGNINYYLKQPKSEALILGSSRAHHHVIPDSISSRTFNLSHNGMRIGFQAGLIEVLSKTKLLPDSLLLLHIEPESFVAPNRDLLLEFQYLKYYYNSNKYIKSNIDKLSKFEKVKYWLSIYRFNGTIPSLIRNSLKSVKKPNRHDLGFAPLDAGLPGRIEKAQKDYDLDPHDFRKSMAHAFLNHILAACKEQKVKVVLFTSPYYRTTSHPIASKHFLEYIESMNVDYFYYPSKQIDELKELNAWHDQSHLSSHGAAIFSSLLAKDLMELK